MWIKLDDAVSTQIVFELKRAGNDRLAAIVDNQLACVLARPSVASEYIDAARRTYVCDDIQIDDDSAISESDGGAFVMGWLWISRNDADGRDVFTSPSGLK